MQYFEQVQRGIRTPGRALAPAICALALCTAVLMVAAWPKSAYASNYVIHICNTTDNGNSIKLKRIRFKFAGSSWTSWSEWGGGSPWTFTNTKTNNFQTSHTSHLLKSKWYAAIKDRHRWELEYRCDNATTYERFRTARTSKQHTHVHFEGCNNNAIEQDHSN